MQPHTSTTDPGLRGSLWIDQAHHHRLVEVIRVLDNERVLMQPVRAARLKPPPRRGADVIRDELARPRAKACRCPITPASTIEELRALGAGSTAGRWVCAT